VLVLNRLWQAVHIVPAKRALQLLSLEHARVLHPSGDGGWQVWPSTEWFELSYDQPANGRDHYVHTVRQAVRIPKIILLNDYGELPLKEVHLNRQSIFERDGHCCQYCGRTFKSQELNLDHVIPRERGGVMSWENIVTSCIPCNTRKGNRTPAEAQMRLMKKPKQPKSRPFVTYIIGQEVEDEWHNFLHTRHEFTDVEIIPVKGEPRPLEAVVG